MRRIAVITGTGLYHLTNDVGPTNVRIDTPYGPLDMLVHETDDLTVFHVNRHGKDHGAPPHRLDPRRTVDAVARCRVDAVLSLQNTGGLRPDLSPGHLVVPHDLVDFSHHPHHTFYDEEVVHIDFQEPYCTTTRRALLEAISRSDRDPETVHERGVYVSTRGPRFETPAEVSHLARLGDVIGMTGGGEAALARERGLCYAALAFVANPAAGIAGPRRDAIEIQKALADEAPSLQEILLDAARALSTEKGCRCAQAPEAGRLGPVTQP